jgi:putative ABC transport system permease protein
MNFGEVIKSAWNSLVSNKLRSLLTMLGVIIGVAAVIMMISISAGTEATIAESINGLGSNLAFISAAFTRGGPGGGPENSRGGLVYDDVTAIRDQINGVAGVSVEQQASENVKYNDIALTGVTVVGTTPDYTTVREVKVANGRWLTEDEQTRAEKVVILGSKVATELFGTADPVGQTILVGDTTQLAVIGVLAPKGLSGGTNFDELVYTPISVVFKKFTPSQFARIMGDRVRTIFVSVEPKASMTDVIQQITLLLETRHKVTADTLDFTITTQQDIISTQESTTSSFRTLLAWVAGVSLIVGGIGIMNIMLVSVTERTREIGIRMSVGARRRDILLQFLSESVILSLLGGIIGILLALAVAYGLKTFVNTPTLVSPSVIAASVGFAAAVGIFFGFYPARKASNLYPIDALRYE